MVMKPRGVGWIRGIIRPYLINLGLLDATGAPADQLPEDVTKGNIVAADGTVYGAIPIGTDTHVLTADSAEDAGLKWAAAAAGGRVTSWKTVGTDASDDYATVQAAFAASQYNLILTSSVTETIDSNVSGSNINIFFESPNITWTFADGIEFTSASYTKVFRVYMNGGTLAWAYTTAGVQNPFNLHTGGTPTVEFYGGGTFTNTSTQSNTEIVDGNAAQRYFGHYVFNLPNALSGGVDIGGAGGHIESIDFVGGGTSCYDGLSINANAGAAGGGLCDVEQLEFSGTWSATGGQIPFTISGNADSLNVGMILWSSSSASDLILDCPVRWFRTNSGSTNDIEITSDTRVRGGVVQSGNTYTLPTDMSECVFEDVLNADFVMRPGHLEYKTLSTTDATQTEIELVSATYPRLTLASDTSALVNYRLISQRDNQDWATFQGLNCIIENDGGVYAVTNGATGGTPDQSAGTGSTLTIDVDASSGLRFRVTANASENWDHKLVIDYVQLTN